MAVRRKQIRSVVILSLVGGFYGGKETDELEKAFKDEAAGGNTRLILNMSECTMLTSRVMTVLVDAHKNYSARGGLIKMCGLFGRAEAALHVPKLTALFDQYKTETEALAAFAEKPDERQSETGRQELPGKATGRA